ncbi:MAG TPA: hypothetical protein VFC68_03110 [Treponemataceae bacterium]|nr:hypothetical protein [Treponemataceae bacterium]
MLNKNCEKTMNVFLALDKNEHSPFSVLCHFLVCKKCRKNAIRIKTAEKIGVRDLSQPVSLSNQTLVSIMNNIDPSFLAKETKTMPFFSMVKWIVIGFFIVCLMLVFGIFFTISARQGMYAVATTTFAIVITAYCIFFVASNLDFFVKKLSL